MSPLEIPYSFAVSTGEQCRDTDRDTMERFGIDGFTLMETAGLQAAQYIAAMHPGESTGLFLCGKGNNGGDALVAARYLTLHYNHRCSLVFPSGTGNLTTETRRNLALLQALADQGHPLRFHESPDELMPQSLFNPSMVSGQDAPDYIVDGLLGTGLEKDLREPISTVADRVNRMNAPVFSLDIPTGLNSDRGSVMGGAIHASHTLSFGSRKLGFYLNSGPLYTGKVHAVNLSFPPAFRKTMGSVILPELAEAIPPISRRADHKYSDRTVFVVAGSSGLTGAAIMAASSAWRAGVGAVTLITPRGLLDIYEKTLPGIIKFAVGNTEDFCFKEHHSGTVLEHLHHRNGVLLMGPGLGRKEETLNFARTILSHFKGSAVIDADALRAMQQSSRPAESEWILTPHPGEAGSLAGKDMADDYERVLWAGQYSQEKHLWLVSKGNPVFIGTPEGRNYISGYDTRIFARAGFGDILCGRISGNLAISSDPELSILRALLDTERQSKELHKTLSRPLEPMDFL